MSLYAMYAQLEYFVGNKLLSNLNNKKINSREYSHLMIEILRYEREAMTNFNSIEVSKLEKTIKPRLRALKCVLEKNWNFVEKTNVTKTVKGVVADNLNNTINLIEALELHCLQN